MRKRAEILLLLFFSLASFSAPAETLYYEASYQGLFSAGETISIAAISLDSGPAEQSDGGALFQSRMQVTSRPYAFVEQHYPFRVRYRSLWNRRSGKLLAMENYEKTRKVKHQIIWVDWEKKRMQRFRPKGKNAGQQLFPVSLRYWLTPGESFQFHKYGRHRVPDGMLDWLSMLQDTRSRDFRHEKRFHYTVTDGKHLYHYRVRVKKRQLLKVEGTKRWTWKLRFDATEEGVPGPAHRPVLVWMTDDGKHTPVQFESHHPLGRFSIRLSSAAASAFQ
ncbi:DUF3108 domain-containing protein [Thiolapillus sp.]